MRRFLPILFLPLLVAMQNAVAQETMTTTVPIFTQKVSFDTENTWKAGWQSPKNPASYTLELVPGNETAESSTKIGNHLRIQGHG